MSGKKGRRLPLTRFAKVAGFIPVEQTRVPDRLQFPASQPAFGQSDVRPFVDGVTAGTHLSVTGLQGAFRIQRRQRFESTSEDRNDPAIGGSQGEKLRQKVPVQTGQIHGHDEQPGGATVGQQRRHASQRSGVGRRVEHDVHRVRRRNRLGTVGMLGDEQVGGTGFMEQAQLALEEAFISHGELGFGVSHPSALAAGQDGSGEEAGTHKRHLPTGNGWGSLEKSNSFTGHFMKHLLKFAVAAALAGGFLTVRAADAKEVTVTGTGACAKCELKKSDSCQNVVQVKDGDKTTTYFLTGDVSKAFHKNLCSSTMKVTVTGKATQDGDKNMIAVTKIEAAK